MIVLPVKKWMEIGKMVLMIRKLSFIHHSSLLEIKAGNKYDKILTVANSGGRVKIELLCCSLEMSESFHFLKRKVENGERWEANQESGVL